MPNLHIALCTDGIFPLAVGGMQRHSRLLAEHLCQLDGIRLTVFHPHTERLFDPALHIREVQVAGISTERLYLRELWNYSGRMGAALSAEMAKPDGPTVILSQGFSIWQGIHRFSRRLMVHPHGLEMFQGLTMKERAMGWPFRRLVRHVARNSAAVVSLGGKLTPILEQLVAGSPSQVVVVPNAVEVPVAAAPYPPDAGSLQLLFVGRFASNKGIDLLMEVAHRLQDESWGQRVHFNLAGGGPLLAHYKARDLPPNVSLPGRVDDEQLHRLYTECHAFVLPTRFEGMPTVVLEAMARARPVLVSNVGATGDLVADGKSGFLLPAGNSEALYMAIRRFAEMDPGQRRDMGLEGYRCAKARFAWPVVAKLHAEALSSLSSHAARGNGAVHSSAAS